MESNQVTIFILIGILLYLALIITSIYKISRSNMKLPQQLIWYAVIIFAPFIGSIMFWVMGRKKD